ncbi:MAG: PASTA domain-containing protein [Planctomycetota bacterium]
MRSNSLCAKCIIIVSFVCLFASISNAGYWVELGWGNYTDGGGDCSLYESGTHAVGTYSANIQDDTGTAGSFYHTNGVDIHNPGYTQIKVDFWFKAMSMESGEDFWVQYYDGSTWQTVADYISGAEFVNDQTYPNTIVIIDEGSYNFPPNMKIRFMCDASGNSDDVYIDEIIVSGWVDADDTTPPTPNPAEFSTAPTAASATSISMTATAGTDISLPIEYSFVETTGNPGATSSGWTTLNTYTDDGLNPGTTYTYTVQMRDSSSVGANTGTASGGLSATTLAIVPDVTSLVQATAEANIESAGFIVGSITNSFSNTVAFGDVISQTPVAGTELALGSSINLNVSKGTTTTDFEDLVAFAQNWLDTNCGLCSDQDYSGDNDVDFQDFALFGQEWLLQPPATLVINEFMASNDTTIPDGFGEYDDWIEIYNYGTDPIVMDGMHLAATRIRRARCIRTSGSVQAATRSHSTTPMASA